LKERKSQWNKRNLLRNNLKRRWSQNQ